MSSLQPPHFQPSPGELWWRLLHPQMAAEPSAQERVTAKATPAAAMACTKADSRVAVERGRPWARGGLGRRGPGLCVGQGWGERDACPQRTKGRGREFPNEIPQRAQEEMLDVNRHGEAQGRL